MKLNNLLEEKKQFDPADPTANVDLNAFVEYVAPSTELEKRLTAVFSTVLNIPVIGIYDDFFDNGGHSLMALKLISTIYLEFGIELTIREIISHPTVDAIARLIGNRKETAPARLVFTDAARHEPFPLTPIQLSYLLGREAQFELGGVSTRSYQEFVATVDIKRFNQAFHLLMERHPMLKAVIDEDGRQRILPGNLQFDIPIVEFEGDTVALGNFIAERRSKLSHRIFKPSVWPLFDMQAVKIEEGKFYFFLGIDTMIADAQSKMILFNDLMRLYSGQHLPPLG